MIEKFNSGGGIKSADKKLYQRAVQMLEETKRKIEYIRMQQLLIRSQAVSGIGGGDNLGINFVLRSNDKHD